MTRDMRTAFGREHEEALVRFISSPANTARFKEVMRKVAAGRTRVITAHLYDPSYAIEFRSPSAATVERTLRSKGAPERAWIVSNSGDLDGLELPLGDAIRRVLSSELHESVISCIPGRLAFFHSGEDHWYRVLERTD